MKNVDLRSDTVTQPTAPMREAMFAALSAESFIASSANLYFQPCRLS